MTEKQIFTSDEVDIIEGVGEKFSEITIYKEPTDDEEFSLRVVTQNREEESLFWTEVWRALADYDNIKEEQSSNMVYD